MKKILVTALLLFQVSAFGATQMATQPGTQGYSSPNSAQIWNKSAVSNKNNGSTSSVSTTKSSDPVVAKAEKVNELEPNYFTIALHKPNYVLPFYYTASPYNKVYNGQTPDGESLKKIEFKYQFSFKVPVWKNILGHPNSLYLAYTQLSYWQLYNKRAFFRETDYEPEIFLENQVLLTLFKDLKLTFINIGANHQSNGFGNDLERTWNRVYLEAIFSKNDWMIDLKPWYVVNDSSKNFYNPDIANYLGYGQVVIAYKLDRNAISLRGYNFVERGGKRPSFELTWSFPITPYIKGYVQGFSGYGQSLIEYDHHTNSFGLGVALNDWV